MLPVYICEDEEQIRNMERAWLEKQILIQGYDMKVVLSTGNPEELLECLDRKSGQGIYFLDVELKGASMNGSPGLYLQTKSGTDVYRPFPLP